MGVIAYLLVASGGVNSVKGMWVIIGLPISFVMILNIITTFKASVFCYNKQIEVSKEEI